MSVYLYFSLIPEALIASNLPPEAFGQYYATGHQCKSTGEAVFFEVDPAFRHDYFPIEEGIARCQPHPDGSPKNSVWLSVYRVLEHLPVAALGKLHLTTRHGKTLALARAEAAADEPPGRHLYQDLAPSTSLVASALGPAAYYRAVTLAPSKFIQFPALAFVELGLGALENDPENGAVGDLPYSYLHPLRESLLLLEAQGKQTKLVQRARSVEFPYRMVKRGFHIGNGADLAFYAMPTHEALRRDHANWWRLANL